ncbi:MAG TPA: methyltransferase domain-containing protein [Candidatus Kapabacteria bacterium]|nr:methyltransferase domain-containing protein [Candidatus Kapabacteria bacterium]
MDSGSISDTWERGGAYERFVGRWSRRVAPEFLAWLDVPAARRWLDVGCGTGALAATIIDRCSPSAVFGVEPSEGFLATARAKLGGHATLLHGDAMALPLGDASVDVVVAGLVLNFVLEPRAALLEMARVTGAGGTIAVYVWDYSGAMEFIRMLWDVAIELDPAAAALDEGTRFPLCQPAALNALFDDAGLDEVDVRAIDIPTVFADFDEYWQPLLGGQGPAPAYVMSLEESARTALRDRLRERLPIAPDGSISLTARAWAVRSRVA